MKIATIFLAMSVCGAEYFVAPSGLPSNSGTIDSPWSLDRVCTGSANPSPIQAGDTIWLRGGTYVLSSMVWCRFVGTAAQRIRLLGVPGEDVEFLYMPSVGRLRFDNSEYLDFGSVRLRYAGNRINRIYSQLDPWGTPLYGYTAISSTYMRFINIVDLGLPDVVGYATGTERGPLFYGIVYHTGGSEAPDRGHGAVAYQQNYDSVSEPEYAENVIALPGYRTSPAWQSTASQAAYVQRIRLKNIISAVSVGIGSYGGCSVSMNEMYLQDSLLAGAPSLPYSCNTAKDAVVTGNLMATGYSNPRASGGTYSNNWAVGGFSVTTCSTLPEGGACTAPTVSNNQTTTPVSNWVVVYPNVFESGRAHIGIYNWLDSNSQLVDMSSVWEVGQPYEVIDAWNMLGAPVWSGIYEGGSISLPLDGRAGTYQPEGRTDACWHVGRETCCTSGDYVCAATVEQLPTDVGLNTPGLETATWGVHYWNGAQWVSLGYTMPAQRNKIDTGRGDGRLHAFVARRPMRKAQRTTVHWLGSTSDTVEYLVDGTWRTSLGKICVSGRCEAEILGYGGIGEWRINGGSAMRAYLR